MLGFGHADATAVPGQSYDYRVSGRFVAADLADEVYEVHQIPPAQHFPPPSTSATSPSGWAPRPRWCSTRTADPDGLTATSRRGIALTPGDPAGGFVSWWSPDLSCVIDLPRSVERLVLEIPAAHGFSYSGQCWQRARRTVPDRAPGPLRGALVQPARSTRCGSPAAGTVYALRLPAEVGGVTELSQVCSNVQLAPTPLPAPPVTVAAVGLQTPPTILTGAHRRADSRGGKASARVSGALGAGDPRH